MSATATATEAAALTNDRSYWRIVARQFRRNRRAVWALRVVVALILIAIYAPLIANDKPLAFHGYRYKQYFAAYEALPYAHAELAGLGREGAPFVLEGVFDEGVVLEGLPAAYRRDMRRWEEGNPTWRMVRNNAFGAAQDPMNALRAALEEAVPGLTRDRQWARGTRDVFWLREQHLPTDVERDLLALVEQTRDNVPVAYAVKARLRLEAIEQLLSRMEAEVGGAARRTIKGFRARYRAAVDPTRFFAAQPEETADLDAMVRQARLLLDPAKVAFRSHTDFPALRQLTSLDVFLMLAVLLLITRGVWSLPLGWWPLPFGPRLRRQLAVSVALPLLLAIGWAFVPNFNDTTDYRAGMTDGSLWCAWRVVAPLRYGVNENAPERKYRAPWWWPRLKDVSAAVDLGDLSDPKAAWGKARTAWRGQQASASAPDGAREALQGKPEPVPAVVTNPALRTELEGVQADIQRLKEFRAPKTRWQEWLEDVNRHHMGTDGTGRDLLTRMIWGSRISLSIGFVAVGIYVLIGIVFGSLAGYFGGWIDLAISRLIEVVICFPVFFLILTVIAFIGPSVFNIMVVIGVTGWTGVARLIRGEFLRLRKQDFVVAGQALGFTNARIIFRHVLPNALAPVLVAAAFGVASAILIESSLSFLGFGVKVPTPTWGSILSSARESWIYWWLTMFPGAAIFLAVTMYNLVGEGVRDAVDPKLRQ